VYKRKSTIDEEKNAQEVIVAAINSSIISNDHNPSINSSLVNETNVTD